MFGRDLERTCVCKQFTILIFGQGVLTVRHTADWGRVRALRLMNLVLLNIYTLEGYLSTFSAKLQSSLDDAGCGVEQEGLDSVSANRFPTGEMAS